MGIGFTLALSIMATIREFIGNGSITVWGKFAIQNIHSHAMVLIVLPAGGFVTLGLILAFINHLQARGAQKRGETAPLPLELDCRHCALCKIGE
jgi:electron transport complex protein RnfE